MPLTDATIRSAKPKERAYKLSDGGSLYLLIAPSGGKWWRWKYRRPLTGKENRLSLGVYPDVGLSEARTRRDDARRLLAAGIDPGEHRKATRAAGVERAANTFGAVSEELMLQRERKLSPGSVFRERRILERDLRPFIGDMPVANISAPMLLSALRRIEARGAVETAHRARALAANVFRYAIATGRAERNPASDLIGALASPRRAHFATITEPSEIGPLLRAMHGYAGEAVTAAALKLAPLVFVRPGELRRARWADMDLERAEWRFVATKTDTPHIVPLATQAVEILEQLRPLTGRGEHVFPGVRGKGRPMSENTLNAALRRLGYGPEEMTGHGFRAMARTVLEEVLGFRPDYIEHQLAHSVRDPNGRAYNRTSHLVERRKMMQAWADYLDQLRDQSSNVMPLRRPRAAT